MTILIQTRQEFPRNAPVFIFGAGACGQTVRRAVDGEPGVTIAGFIDNHKSGAQDGLPIVGLDQFRDQAPPDAVIVIATAYHAQVYVQLHKHGLDEFYDAYPLYQAVAEAPTMRAIKIVAAAIGIGLLIGGAWAVWR